MKTSRQKVSKPKGLAGKTFTIDGKELFKALSKGVLHLTQAKWEDAASDALDAISAVGVGTEPAALAHVLLRRAAVRALFALVAETVKSNAFGVQPYKNTVADSVEQTVAAYDIAIDQNLFSQPMSLPLVAGLQDLLGKWLRLLLVPEHIIAILIERLPSYFLYSLNEEWRTNRKLYQPILDSLDTPFAKASDQEWAWRAYSSWLRLQIDESSFDEAFGLRQIYVPLRAYHEEVRGKIGAVGPDQRERIRTIIDLHDELIAWFKKGNRDDAIRVISGGPGSGKSSFAKIFAVHVAEIEHQRTLFIPLHLLDPSRNIEDEVGRFVEDMLPYNPLAVDSKEPRLLLIFDGLDELASQGKAANETARLFIVAIERLISLRNLQALRLQVIISGRELVVQGNESEFRKAHQILTLLPYLIEEDSLGEERLVHDPNGIREYDQRHEWWHQYGRLTGHNYNGLPEPLERKDLQEVTSQPLLNYLVALSYTRGNLDFTQNVNLNQVYEDLVHAVHDRAYEKRRLHVSIQNMEPDEFVRVLEEVGLAAWHGNGRTTTVREIAEHCKASGLEEMLNKFEEGAKAGVTRLLAAFFFRQHERTATGDQTFVFTHKSFGEYLAARRIVRAMSRITNERDARIASPDSGWGEREALVHWAQATSASMLTKYVETFIVNELALRGIQYVRKIQQCFVKLFSYVLKSGMPMEKLAPTTFQNQLRLARNCEEALLVCMAQCAYITREISAIEHPDALAFANWYKRVHEQVVNAEYSILSNNLYYLNLSGIYLAYVNLSECDISYSSFNKSVFYFTIMSGAKANETNFNGALFQAANLTEASFVDCSFKDSFLAKVVVSGTQFRHCDFAKARFENEHTLRGAQFINTTIEYVSYKERGGDELPF